jgi:hypothetical protein
MGVGSIKEATEKNSCETKRQRRQDGCWEKKSVPTEFSFHWVSKRLKIIKECRMLLLFLLEGGAFVEIKKVDEALELPVLLLPWRVYFLAFTFSHSH